MKRKIKVSRKKPYRTYLPQDIAEAGFKGDLDAYANAKTVTLVNPKTPLSEVERSLEIVLQDIRLRMGKKEYTPAPPVLLDEDKSIGG